MGLGIAYHNISQYKKAQDVFFQVPLAKGFIPNEYYQMFGRVLYQLDDNERAIELYQRYGALIGEENLTEQDYVDIAHAYKDDGQMDKYNEYIKKSLEITAK